MSRTLSSRRWTHVGLLCALLAHPPIGGDVIPVSGDCTLAEAMRAANGDDDSGGLCPPGGSGADRLVLSGDVILTEVDHTNSVLGGDTGLPLVTSTITIEGNGFTVARDAGAPDFRIFDVDSGGDLGLEDVTVSGGSLVSGSAILNLRGGVTTLINSTISNNAGSSAIYLWDVWGYGGFMIGLESTVSGNSGTGIRNYYALLSLVSSTVSGNGSGAFGDGVSTGIYSYSYLEQTTISGSRVNGVYNEGVTEISGSIVTGSGSADCRSLLPITDEGGNLDGDGSCPGFDDLSGFDPALADNGGPTQTHALFEESSAIDAAGVCGINRDQRGEPRNGPCDAGAYELQGAPLDGLSGSAAGLETLSGSCANLTAGESVDIPPQPDAAYSCAGMSLEMNDRVVVRLRGEARQTAIRGSVEGVTLETVICTNFTRLERVRALITSNQWHCSAAGFTAAAGERVALEIKGSGR